MLEAKRAREQEAQALVETLKPKEQEERAPETPEQVAALTRETEARVSAAAVTETARVAKLLESVRDNPAATELQQAQQAEVLALEAETQAALRAAEGTSSETREGERSRRFSIWERAREWAEKSENKAKRDSVKKKSETEIEVIDKKGRKKKENQLTSEYGSGVVNGKFDQVYGENGSGVEVAVSIYQARLEQTGRELQPDAAQRTKEMLEARAYGKQAKKVKEANEAVQILEVKKRMGQVDQGAYDKEKTALDAAVKKQQETLEKMPKGRGPESGVDVVLLEEVTQERAYTEYKARVEKGEVVLGAEGIAVKMMEELGLENKEEREVASLEQGLEAVKAELAEYLEKGYINQREMELIVENVEKFGAKYVEAFTGKRFAEGSVMTEQEVVQHAYEAMRDNARKIAFQTKMDKKVFSGSDHGTRHICEGCTHLSEQLMGSLRTMEHVDFQPQDEVLVRQAIVDHDIGYTTEAGQAKGGFEGSKDHPCAGCQFVEANKEWYAQKYGQEGYEVIRDVVLNHSYPQSKYDSERPRAEEGVTTYNRDLIRSVVSTVDAMGVTSETKAMDMFRHPEAIDVLQNVQLYAETHGGKVEDEALAVFKEDLNAIADKLVEEGRISTERAAGYRAAIENQFNPVTVDITLGQFTGVVQEMRMGTLGTGEVGPEIHMDVSRLAALVGDNFGDKTALKGFVKAMEDFGLTGDKLKSLAKLVEQLRGETDPAKREEIQKQLVFESDRARFVIGERETTGLKDEREQEIADVQERFETFERETIRTELRDHFDQLFAIKNVEERHDKIEGIRGDLIALLDLDSGEAQRFSAVIGLLHEHATDDAVLRNLQREASQFKSAGEKQRIGRHEAAVVAAKARKYET